MRIIHVVESFAGGVFDFLVDLVNRLDEHQHLIIHGKRPDTPSDFADSFPEKTRFIFWKNAEREIQIIRDVKALFELLTLLGNNTQCDIVHLHSSKAGFLGRIACRLLNMHKKVIYTSHGVAFLRKDVSSGKRRLFILLEKLAAKFGGTVVACSQSESDEFAQFGIQTRFIHNGIICNEAHSDTASSTHLRIGTVGRITFPKNPALFNDIALAFSNNKNIKFIWIGDGDLRAHLTSPNIEITGWLSKDEVCTELRSLNMYLSTSLWEGLPLSVLQAMCSKKPLLLSNCTGNRDLVKEDFNGFLFNDKYGAISCINRLVHNRELIERMGQRSREIVTTNFSLESTVSMYSQLYDGIHRAL